MPVIRRYRLPDEAATAALAASLAPLLRAGDTVLLDGPLGAGKTSFARALIRRLAGPDTEVPSPTFSLVQTYDLGDMALSHFDLYRIDNPRDLDEIGIDEAMTEDICLIEWPDRLGAGVPADALTVRLQPESGGGGGRVAVLEGNDMWAAHLKDLSDG